MYDDISRKGCAKMSVTLQEIVNYQDEIHTIANSYGVRHIKIGGHPMRGERGGKDDLELLIPFEGNEYASPDYVRLQLELEELLHCRVHIVSEQGLPSKWKETVLRGARPL